MFYLIWTLILLIVFYIALKGYRQHRYFKKWCIPGPKEYPFIGHFGMDILMKYHVNYRMRDLYKFGKSAKYVGLHIFGSPIVIVLDHELIKTVLVKSFDRFAHRKPLISERADPIFGKNLFMLNGEKWRDTRNLLSPSFTSNKMRSMYALMSDCAENFVRQLLELGVGDQACTDCKDLFTRYANDVIATCAFGIEVDSLKERENEFYVRGRRSTNFAAMRLKILAYFLLPSFLAERYVRIVEADDTDFFVGIIGHAISTRREKGIVRPDMLQLMMEAQGKSRELDLVEMTAQAFVFFFGGFETTSSQICMMAYELALRSEIQEKLRAEIDEVMRRSSGRPSYEDVGDMPYLDGVFAETLRLHPLGSSARLCSEGFELPPAVPGAKAYPVLPGTEVWIPVAALHRDPNVYEEPDDFVPERFLRAGKKPFASDVFSLGFGMGPRMCIGSRFAVLETKVLFVHLLDKFVLEPCEKTCVPLEYDVDNMTPAPKGGTWLRLLKRR